MTLLIPNTRTINGPAADLVPIPRTVLDLMTPYGGKPRHIISIDNGLQDELLDILATYHQAAHEHNVLATSRNPQNGPAVAQLRDKISSLQHQAAQVTRQVLSQQEPQTPGQPTPVEQLIDNHPRTQNPQRPGYQNQHQQVAAGPTVGITTQFGPISLPCAVVPLAPASPYRIYTRANQTTRQFLPWPFYPCANYPCVNGSSTTGFAGSASIPLGVIPMPPPPSQSERQEFQRYLLSKRTQRVAPQDVVAAYQQTAESLARAGAPPNPQAMDRPRQFLSRMQPGDELWRYHDDCGGAPLCGSAGFLLTRNGQYVDQLQEWIS